MPLRKARAARRATPFKCMSEKSQTPPPRGWLVEVNPSIRDNDSEGLKAYGIDQVGAGRIAGTGVGAAPTSRVTVFQRLQDSH